MPFEVQWQDPAIDQLAEILRNHRAQRPILIDDANRVDELLEVDPIAASSEVQEGIYATQVGRLRLYYYINDEDQIVTVAEVEFSM